MESPRDLGDTYNHHHENYLFVKTSLCLLLACSPAVVQELADHEDRYAHSEVYVRPL